MKVTLKGNTAKTKKFFPATEDKPAMLYVDLAEKIKRRDNSEITVWHKLKIARGYAETIYKGLHGDEPVSRFIQVEGRIVSEPTVKVANGKSFVYNTIWVDDVTWLDNKRPESELPEEPEGEVETPIDADEETPWD